MTRERQTFGNIPPEAQKVFYLLAALAFIVFACGLWRRVRLWQQGRPVGLGSLLARNRRVLVEGLGQRRVLGRGRASRAHVMLFAGFMMLFLGTVILEVNHVAEMLSASLKFYRGTFYLIYEATLDCFGLLFLAGTALFFGRRLGRPRSIGHRATDWYVLASFLLIGVTGYLLEGLRIRWDHPSGIWAECSPVGLLISRGFAGLTDLQARHLHFALWWGHAVLVFGFIASIPFTRLLHMIAGPLNLFFAVPGLGRLDLVTVEEMTASGRIGAGEIRDFTRQQLLSLDACMECGRCEEACPAFATGKPLSPKKVVQDLRREMTRSGSARPLAGQVILPETLWACTACNACAEVCPVRVDPWKLIVDLRRNLVAEGGLGGSAATALRRMQSSGDPWGLPANERLDWTAEKGAKGEGRFFA